MAKKTFVTLALALAVSFLLPAAALADTAAWEFSSVGLEGTNGDWTFGEVFTVNQNINVTYLGSYNPTTGMADTHSVGIFDANGNLLTSNTVDSSACCTTAHWLYNPAGPTVELFAGQTYIIEATSGIDPYAWNDGGFTVYAPITVLGNNWVLNGGLTFNGLGLANDTSDGYWGANFGWVPVSGTPEPGSLALFGTGIVGLAGMIRRKLNF